MFEDHDSPISFAKEQKTVLIALSELSQATDPNREGSKFSKEHGYSPTKKMTPSYSLISQVAGWVSLAGGAPCFMVLSCQTEMLACIHSEDELPDVTMPDGSVMNYRDVCRHLIDQPMSQIPIDPTDTTALPFQLRPNLP